MKFSLLLGFSLIFQQLSLTNHITDISKSHAHININQRDLFLYSPNIPVIPSKELNHLMDEIDNQVKKKPKDAFIDSNGNIQPEKQGFQLDRHKFIESVYWSYFENKPLSSKITLEPIYPKVDSELLDAIRTKKIGRYVTQFNQNKVERSNNILLAAEAINNTVVFPNETFSFNKVVGQRTLEKGYLNAPVIIDGEYSKDIGGGICQVSSTLFNAVDNAGLEIVERYSHSREINYVPPKRDATVSWDGPDFVFQNNYNQPVLIQAKKRYSHLIIEIYSSDSISNIPRKVPYLP